MHYEHNLTIIFPIFKQANNGQPFSGGKNVGEIFLVGNGRGL